MNGIHRDDCIEVFRSIHDYVDRELPPGEMARVRAHLETCAVCAREFRFEAQVLDELRARLCRVAAPPRLVSRLMAELRAGGAGSDREGRSP